MKQEQNYLGINRWLLGAIIAGCGIWAIPNRVNHKTDVKPTLETKVVQEVGVKDVREKTFDDSNYEILGQYIYGEAANQNELSREAVGKTMSNRKGKKGYKDNLKDVILSDSRFTCVGSKKNKNWKQATGELLRNEYEEIIYQRCLQDAKDVLNGKDLGYENQNDWIAYFDSTTNYEKVCKLDSYWKTLKPDVTIGDLTFCVPREK